MQIKKDSRGTCMEQKLPVRRREYFCAKREYTGSADRTAEETMVWSQVYDPLNNAWLSTFVAALPVIVLLGALGIFRMKAHVAALLGLAVALAAAVFVFRMPAVMAGKTAL